MTNEELLTLPCDILILAALENQLRSDNASDVQARMIVELANGPTTPDANSVFHERAISVLPDIGDVAQKILRLSLLAFKVI